MSRHFAEIAYTPSVRAMQRRYVGTEAAMPIGDAIAELGRRECEFIAARDSFYLATVSETGWPHVQHRGGAVGFLKVLGRATLAFADYGGNRQMVSVGNLAHQQRAALILVDYPQRRRLKLLGEIDVHDARTADPALLAAVASSAPPAERIMVMRVAAFDWNCSQHITPRYTASDLTALGWTPPNPPTRKELL